MVFVETMETMLRRRRKRGGRRKGHGQPRMGPASYNDVELRPGLGMRMIPVSENGPEMRKLRN